MTTYQTITIDGLDVFYREAGPQEAPTILLLHGFPSSSHMYRNLIAALSNEFHLVAPDYPGFGNSESPALNAFEYSFDRLAEIMEHFIQALELTQFSLFIQDYGGPVGFRIAAKHPDWIQGLIVQNAVAYAEGLGSGFDLIKALWQERTKENEQAVLNLMKPDFTKLQYVHGARCSDRISPDTWNMDQSFLDRPGNAAIQLELQYDYRNNVKRYPEWQAYFRKYQPPTLVIWGKNDLLFTTEGALAHQRDLNNIELHLLDSGHFALEEEWELISILVSRFFASRFSFV